MKDEPQSTDALGHYTAQIDDDGNVTLGHGPFPSLTEVVSLFGHDEHSYIVLDNEDGSCTKLYHWDVNLLHWKKLGVVEKPKDGKEGLLQSIGEKYFNIAEDLPLSEEFVKGEGSLNPSVLIIGDYPEDGDHLTPYNGPQGETLKGALLAAGLTFKTTYLTTLVKHTRLADNSKLTFEEARLFVPLLFQEIRVLEPKSIVLLGLMAAQAFLNKKGLALKDALRTVYHFKELPGVPIRVAFHPKYVNHAGGEESKTFSNFVVQLQHARKK